MKQQKERCQTCGHIVSERQIALFRGLVGALWRVWRWAEGRGIHEFSRQDIKHLFRNENETARFGDLVLFGGLVYKHSKGHYGLNRERCHDFFSGRLPIPTLLWKNPITGDIRPEQYRYVKDIPTIMELLTKDLEYVANYR